jgi:predicted CXXCH cytochrome family protein
MTGQQKERIQSRALIAAAVCGSLFAGSLSAGTIVGSQHDFSNRGWTNPNGEICVFCHTPHNADTEVLDAPLWNHEVTQATHTLYDSPTFDGATTIGQPGGASLLCLSCHDGTVAIDSYGDITGTHFIPERANLGTDLSNDHPISFAYDAALVALDGSLHDPAAITVTIGTDKTKTGTIEEVMLFDNQLQCASCHDVHNTFTVDYKLLKLSLANSELCLTCHDK